ncbi:hypothetical protein V6Z12_A11G287000 [Gossypium hirsutum]
MTVSVLKESFITKNLFIYFIEDFLPYFLFSSRSQSGSHTLSAYLGTLLTSEGRCHLLMNF